MQPIARHAATHPTALGGASRGALLLPALLVMGIVLLVAWRIDGSGGATTHRGARGGAAAGSVATRTWQDVQLAVPSSWVVLSRGHDHITWGAADRAHTVTLGVTPSSVLPLPGVVQGAVRAAAAELPGTAATGDLATVELDRAPAGDTAVAAAFQVRVPAGAGRGGSEVGRELQVRQVWRRDAVGGRDLVATWTSIDGRWPARPTQHVPRPVVR